MKMHSLKINNESGFSLVEVIIASVLMTIAALAFSNMQINQARSMVALEDKYSKLSLTDRVKSLLVDPISCAQTLQGLKAINQNITAIKNRSGAIELSTSGVQQRFDNLEIQSMRLTNIDVPNTANAYGRMTVTVNVDRTRQTGMITLAPIVQEIFVSTNASRDIFRCSGSVMPTPTRHNYSANRSQWNEAAIVVDSLGPNRNCFALLKRFTSTYRYNGAGCYYTPSSGDVTITGAQTVVYCEVICYD